MFARILYCLDYYNHLFGVCTQLNWTANLLFYNLYNTTVFIVQKSFIYNLLKITSNICLFISLRKVGNRCSHLTSIKVYSHEFQILTFKQIMFLEFLKIKFINFFSTVIIINEKSAQNFQFIENRILFLINVFFLNNALYIMSTTVLKTHSFQYIYKDCSETNQNGLNELQNEF